MLSLFVTVLLAVVGKRRGVSGVIAERKEANELLKTAEQTADEEDMPVGTHEKSTTAVDATQSIKDSGESLATPVESEEDKLL